MFHNHWTCIDIIVHILISYFFAWLQNVELGNWTKPIEHWTSLQIAFIFKVTVPLTVNGTAFLLDFLYQNKKEDKIFVLNMILNWSPVQCANTLSIELKTEVTPWLSRLIVIESYGLKITIVRVYGSNSSVRSMCCYDYRPMLEFQC